VKLLANRFEVRVTTIVLRLQLRVSRQDSISRQALRVAELRGISVGHVRYDENDASR
jgi:hypothetical protein